MSVHKNYIKIQKYRTELFKKHWKLQTFDKILYCGMNRFRNVKLVVFRQYQKTKTILKK